MVFTLRVDWTVALPVIWRSPPKTERPTTAKEESGEEEAIETVPVAEKEVAVEVAEIFRFPLMLAKPPTSNLARGSIGADTDISVISGDYQQRRRTGISNYKDGSIGTGQSGSFNGGIVRRGL